MPLRTAFRILAVIASMSVPALAAPSFDAIYVFGDSYCDVGNVYFATKGAIPLSPPYYSGRFSNGPIWVEHVASAWGLRMQPSLKGGTDYAFGGAYVTQSVSTPEGTIPSVPQQVELYLSQHEGHADPRALYILEGGGDDILNATGGSPEDLGFKIATGLAESELLLRKAGAKSFLIPDLLNVALLPAAQSETAFAAAATKATNAWLNELLFIEGFLEDIRIYRVDAFSLFNAVTKDATHFGFTEIKKPCINPVTESVCADPDHTLFWDVEHPTVFGHSFFAVLVEQEFSHYYSQSGRDLMSAH